MKFRKYFKWVKIIYLILALLTVAVGLPNILSADAAAAALQKLGVKSIPSVGPQITMTIAYFMEAAVYVWLSWLAERIAKDKSQGVFLAFLLAISIASAVYSVIKGIQVQNLLNLAADIIMLVMLIGVWVTDK